MNDMQLFDVNGCIGKGAYEKPEFPGLKELIAHMDYLGIERNLVWHYQARDTNPTWGNKKLLDEMAQCPEAEKRIIPAFTVTPACFYENGTLEFLKESMKKGITNALRIFPSVSRFPVRQLERILKELAEYKPVVFFDCRSFKGDESVYHDIEYLCEKIPEIKFVVTQKMWGGFGSIIDLMWRTKNVYVDISWVHMRENIELLVREFGIERVLFGTGFKSHYGAAIAALMHADLTDDQKEMIAHKNVEKLLGLKKADFQVDGDLTDKPLWKAFRQGRPCPEPVIDSHGHAGPTTRGWFLPENEYEPQLEKLVKIMDSLNVEKLVVSGENALFADCVEGNKILKEKAAPYAGRIYGYVTYNPLYGEELDKELDNLFAGDFYVGFKILSAYWNMSVQDEGFKPALAYADKHAMPMLFHTWNGSTCRPSLFTDMVKEYPNVKFLLGHSGGGTAGRVEAVELANASDNVYLEYCGSFTTPLDWVDTFEQVGFDKVLFGSDTSAHNQAWELGKLLSTPVPDEKLIPVLGENMQKMLSIK
ncbi:MAG: amidohydrolase family protein [Planctomycetota bacterium]|jgi:predicted TIM-barrel fold metal-dependent hydrolase